MEQPYVPPETIFIKQEPGLCEDDFPVTIKEEPVEFMDDLSGFDPHAWALDHLKIETKEIPIDQYSSCRFGPEFTSPNYNYNINHYQGIQEYGNHTGQIAVCSNPFSIDYSAWNHMEKLFFCEICHKSFSTKGNLGNHMRSHTQEKPFRCNICGRCFSFNCNLKTHYLTHTGIKPFQCSTCGKRFSTKGNMSVHLRIHTGERPYKCIVCFRSFTVKDNLQRHMKIHAPP